MHLLLLPLPGAISEPLPTQIKSPLGDPTICWASSKLPSSLCVVTLHPSVQLPRFTDMETEAQKGKVTCWRQSRAGAQPRAFYRPTCSLCCFPFLGTPAQPRRGKERKPVLLLCARSCARMRFLKVLLGASILPRRRHEAQKGEARQGHLARKRQSGDLKAGLTVLCIWPLLWLSGRARASHSEGGTQRGSWVSKGEQGMSGNHRGRKRQSRK